MKMKVLLELKVFKDAINSKKEVMMRRKKGTQILTIQKTSKSQNKNFRNSSIMIHSSRKILAMRHLILSHYKNSKSSMHTTKMGCKQCQLCYRLVPINLVSCKTLITKQIPASSFIRVKNTVGQLLRVQETMKSTSWMKMVAFTISIFNTLQTWETT